MRFLIGFVFSIPLLGLQQAPFRLEQGEFRWIPVSVKQIPTEIECRFQVSAGGPTVHLELMRMHDFRLFNLNRPHDSLAVSPDSRSGAFRRMVDSRGQYAVVVVNEKNAAAVTVSLEVSTEADPNPRNLSREISPRRRLVVILISFAIFFIAVTWSGLKLLRAARAS